MGSVNVELHHDDHEDPHMAPPNANANSLVDPVVAFVAQEDIQPIRGVKDFSMKFLAESKKLWCLAAPAIFTFLCQYMLGAVTQTFAGQIGTLELAAFSVGNVIASFSFGVLMGMGNALQTLCGQAYGAGEVHMLGIYLQRSWIILTCTSLVMTFLYIFATPFLKLIHQTDEIADAAGRFVLWMIPQLFAYAVNFPATKFLQSQSKIMVMAAISGVALVLHTFFSWFLMLRLEWGLAGGAVVLNASWWFIGVAQLIYIFSGTCGAAWSGFSWKAFKNTWGLIRLSLESAVMYCLEIWYFTILVLIAGYLKNAKITVGAFAICMNIMGLVVTEAMGLNAAISVRVSNELGARRPRRAKLSVVVVGIYSLVIGSFFAFILFFTKKQYPHLFSNDSEVIQLVYELTPILAVTLLINNIQPTLTGVAIGAGWQALVAYVNVGCYYLVGIPLGLLMAYKFNMGIKGLWSGMLLGTILQTFILVWIIYKTNWDKEVSIARDRVKNFGKTSAKVGDVERVKDDENEGIPSSMDNLSNVGLQRN